MIAGTQLGTIEKKHSTRRNIWNFRIQVQPIPVLKSLLQRKGGTDDKKEEEPALKLRNYRPLDEEIHRAEIEPAEVKAIDEHVSALEEEAKQDAPGADTNELGNDYLQT